MFYSFFICVFYFSNPPPLPPLHDFILNIDAFPTAAFSLKSLPFKLGDYLLHLNVRNSTSNPDEKHLKKKKYKQVDATIVGGTYSKVGHQGVNESIKSDKTLAVPANDPNVEDIF